MKEQAKSVTGSVFLVDQRHGKKGSRKDRKLIQLKNRSKAQLQKSTALAKSNKRLASANSTFKTKNLTLTLSNTSLKESNMELAKTIEILKNIDRHVEEKRKTYYEHQTP